MWMVGVVATPAAALVVGVADTPGNTFPFGSAAGTRYQQIYAASNFSESVTITGINFLLRTRLQI